MSTLRIFNPTNWERHKVSSLQTRQKNAEKDFFLSYILCLEFEILRLSLILMQKSSFDTMT